MDESDFDILPLCDILPFNIQSANVTKLLFYGSRFLVVQPLLEELFSYYAANVTIKKILVISTNQDVTTYFHLKNTIVFGKIQSINLFDELADGIRVKGSYLFVFFDLMSLNERDSKGALFELCFKLRRLTKQFKLVIITWELSRNLDFFQAHQNIDQNLPWNRYQISFFSIEKTNEIFSSHRKILKCVPFAEFKVKYGHQQSERCIYLSKWRKNSLLPINECNRYLCWKYQEYKNSNELLIDQDYDVSDNITYEETFFLYWLLTHAFPKDVAWIIMNNFSWYFNPHKKLVPCKEIDKLTWFESEVIE